MNLKQSILLLLKTINNNKSDIKTIDNKTKLRFIKSWKKKMSSKFMMTWFIRESSNEPRPCPLEWIGSFYSNTSMINTTQVCSITSPWRGQHLPQSKIVHSIWPPPPQQVGPTKTNETDMESSHTSQFWAGGKSCDLEDVMKPEKFSCFSTSGKVELNNIPKIARK